MIEILNYIDRLKSCGLGKQKCLEFLEKFVEMRIDEKKVERFAEMNLNEEDEPIVKCKDCIHADSPALTDSLATENEVYCEVLGQLRMMDWFCANGRERKND